MTKKFTVQCYVTYTQAYEVEAESEDEAIEKAKWLDINEKELVFIGTDTYEVLEDDASTDTNEDTNP
jgi:hypothetical protein